MPPPTTTRATTSPIAPARTDRHDAARPLRAQLLAVRRAVYALGRGTASAEGCPAGPEPLAAPVPPAQVAAGSYTNDSEAIRDLIRQAQARHREIEAIQAALIEGDSQAAA